MQYQIDASKTEAIVNVSLSEIDSRLLHAAMGLDTESGEFMDALKRWVFYGKPYDPDNLKEEIGDILWYAAQACNALGIDMQDVMDSNIRKLKRRYPDKFSADKAINRDLEAEREALKCQS